MIDERVGSWNPDLMDEYEAGELAVEYDDQTPEAVIEWALDRFGQNIAVCTSFQAEGMAILDMAWRINPKVRVFTMDTGRMHQETYDLMDEVRDHYRIPIEIVSPDAADLQAMQGRYGTNLFYKDVKLRLYCCDVRKVAPLKKKLETLDGWITGLRRDQWASRSNIRKIEIDHDHGGLAKISPAADWTQQEVWDYNRAHNVPSHKLYEQGYTSIGCAPCTRPTTAGQDPRAGRWWWEKGAPKECGIHCPIETGGMEHELEALLSKGDR